MDTGGASAEWTQVESSLLEEMKENGIDITDIAKPPPTIFCPKCFKEYNWINEP